MFMFFMMVLVFLVVGILFMFVMLMVFVVVSIVIVRRMVAEYRATQDGVMTNMEHSIIRGSRRLRVLSEAWRIFLIEVEFYVT